MKRATDNPHTRRVCQVLAERVVALSMSGSSLAGKAGLGVAMVYEYLAGNNPVPDEKLCAIVAALGWTMTEFYQALAGPPTTIRHVSERWAAAVGTSATDIKGLQIATLNAINDAASLRILALLEDLRREREAR